MKTWLKRIYYRWVYQKINVKLAKGVTLNVHNEFEGHNFIGANTEIATCKIGLGSYVSENSVIRKTIIGRFCSLGSNIRTGLGMHPTKDFVSTHPAFFSTQKQAGFSFVDQALFQEHIYLDDKQSHVVSIGNDVWIGSNVLIMDGITIGDGAIIAAGAVVTKNVAPYSIAGGVPAKLIRLRFNQDQVDKLLNIKWWNWDFQKIKANSHLLNNVESFVDTFN
jgi:acetyltransferase-like isoleucine patch superfamily enzyme